MSKKSQCKSVAKKTVKFCGNTMLKLENITAGYQKHNPILKGVNLAVGENEVVAIVGQNGAGKSTLAKAIVNMLPYVSGNIYFKGELLNGNTTGEIINKGINFFLQGGRVFPHLTVEENLNFAGIGLSKSKLKERKEEVMSYFDLFNKSSNGRLSLEASYLSGGEQHQLALAMVMMKKPQFLILDEPSAGLSPGNIKQLYGILNNIREDEKKSILLIEQNLQLADKFSDRIVFLNQGLVEDQDTNLSKIQTKIF